MSASGFAPVRRYPQLAKQGLLTGTGKGNAGNRVWAKIIDVGFVFTVAKVAAWFWAPLAFIVPVILFSEIERWGKWQSPGKWLMGLHTINVDRGTKPSRYNALLRNLPFIQILCGLEIQRPWVSLAVCLPAAVWLFFEIYFINVLRSGVRVGDVLGHTRVFDYKDEHTKFIEEFLREENPL